MNNFPKEFLVGNTPLIRLRNIEKELGLKAELYAKLEWYNLTGSAKDRPALQMILDAKTEGLCEGATIIEATSGNMGIALAGIGQKLGYHVVIVMPENMSEERKMMIRGYNAELVLTDKNLGMQGALEMAEKICQNRRGSVKMMQFSNQSNAKAHYLSTGPEIFEQLGDVDVFVAGIGTGGTISGTGKFLKEQNPKVQIVGVEPLSSPLLTKGKCDTHKIQGIGANFVPKILDRTIIDEVVDVSDDDAFNSARLLAKSEALMVGISSGAALKGACEIASREQMSGKKIVTVFVDSGIKYLSTGLFD